MLADIPRLITAYYTEKPDPRCDAARQLRDIGPSRIVPVEFVQRGAHPRDHAGDLRVSIRERCQRSSVSCQRHARVVGAGFRDRAGGAGGKRNRDDDRLRPRVHADSGVVARHPHLQRRARERARRWHRDHAVPQSPGGRRLQIQPAQRRSGRHHGYEMDREPRQRDARGRTGGRPALHGREGARRRRDAPSRLCLRVRQRTWARSSIWKPSAPRSCRLAPTRWAAPESPTGSASPNGTGSILRSRTRARRSYVSLHDRSIGTARSGWIARRRTRWPGSIALKDRFDLAFACDTDHDRHGIVTRSIGLAEPEPLPGGRDLIPVSATVRDGAPMPAWARRWCRAA